MDDQSHWIGHYVSAIGLAVLALAKWGRPLGEAWQRALIARAKAAEDKAARADATAGKESAFLDKVLVRLDALEKAHSECEATRKADRSLADAEKVISAAVIAKMQSEIDVLKTLKRCDQCANFCAVAGDHK